MPDENTIHVVLSPSADGELRHALRSVGREDRVVGATDNLSYGPINPPDPRARLDWMVSELGLPRDEWDWLPESVDEFWERALAPGLRRVVWVSRNVAYEYAGFLEWIRRVGDAPYEIVDVTDVVATRRGRPERVFSLGMMGASDIAKAALWDLAVPFDPIDHQRYLEAWRSLQAENAPIRIVTPSGLTSAPLTVFDKALSYATTDWRKAARIIGEVMADEVDVIRQSDHVLLASRLLALAGAGALEFREPHENGADEDAPHFGMTALLHDAEVRLPSR